MNTASITEDTADSARATRRGKRGDDRGRIAQVTEMIGWVQNHPVLATVIWVVGKVVEGTTSKATEFGGAIRRDSSSLNSKQDAASSKQKPWTDDYGATLANYYMDSDTESEDEGESYRTRNSSKQFLDLCGFQSSGSLSAPSASVMSPQWGWYVTLTPPQDIYPSASKYAQAPNAGS